MDKNSSTSKKELRERAFAKLGEYDFQEKPKKEQTSNTISETKSIYYDKRQYSCKLPVKLLNDFYAEGDALQFTRNIKSNGEIEILVEYVKKGKKK